MRPRPWLIASLLFGSGFCALVYQVAWLRDFRLIFGASTAASAAVLAIFIGGLGFGGLLIGPRADRHPRPLRLYAQLEAIVALSAAATPFLLAAARYLYAASGGSVELGSTIATVGRVVLSAMVLAVPTIAMGGTLPAAARAATRDTDVRRQGVAALYALNTLGAVVGCFIATFWFLEAFGTRSTLWLAATANLCVVLAAYFIDRVQGEVRLPSPPLVPEKAETIVDENPPSPKKRGKHQAPSTPHPARHQAPGTRHEAPDAGAVPLVFLLLASSTVGFAFFLMELVWYRMLAPILGGSVFTFGLVLAVALAGIGLGGLLYALLAGDKPATLSGFGLCCLIEGAAIAGTYALGDRVAVLALALMPLGSSGFAGAISGWTLVTAVVVLLPAIVAGYQFPLLIALFGRGREEVGRQVGLAYAANTTGAMVGSLAGGFGLLPWLSAPGAWRFAAVVLLVLGAAAIVLSVGRGVRPHLLAANIGLALATMALVNATGPTAAWRHSGIGAGRTSSGQILSSSNQFRLWRAIARRGMVWEADGTESSVALIDTTTGYSFFINGKADGSALEDAGTQVVSGLLGALASPAARRALVIGLGTGSTAGWLGAVPSIERVDVVELEPLILEVARACAPVNRDVMNNGKVHITIGDARELLLTTRDRYDIIVSEPSNPYRAGIASLFTLEYYRAAAQRVTDDGVFVQWVQAYDIDARTLQTVYKTLGTVFPQIETWHTNRGDLVLIASKHQRTYRASDLARRIAEEPFKSALDKVWRAVDIQGLLAHYLANDSMARRFAGSPAADTNTDDRNVVEFGLARSVGHPAFTVADVRNVARDTGASRPPLEDESEVRWQEIDTAIMSYNASVGSFIDPRFRGTPYEQARQAALVRYYRDDDPGAAGRSWEQQPDSPRDPTEWAMVADIVATAASDLALPIIARVRLHQPGEADAILATLRFQQSRNGEAAAAIEAALMEFRTDPWPNVVFKQRAVQLAQALVRRDPSFARRMFDALGPRFAVGAIEDVRLIARAEITRQADFSGLCADAVGALEPHVPWTEPFLRLRRDCYQATSSPRLLAATGDLNEFLGHGAQALAPP